MSDVEKWTWNDAMVMERKGGSYERVSPQRIMKRIAALERELEELRAALKRYGQHLPICTIGGLSGCSCGWDGAKALGEEES